MSYMTLLDVISFPMLISLPLTALVIVAVAAAVIFLIRLIKKRGK